MQYTIAAIKPFLDVIVALITIVGFPVAIYSIFLNGRAARRSTDLQIIMSVSATFWNKWHEGWRFQVNKLSDSAEISEADKIALYEMLNWIDWVGTLMKHSVFTRPDIVLDTIGPSIKAVLDVSRSLLNAEGQAEWSGVFVVARLLDRVENNEIAA
jgi:hypothetical protein